MILIPANHSELQITVYSTGTYLSATLRKTIPDMILQKIKPWNLMEWDTVTFDQTKKRGRSDRIFTQTKNPHVFPCSSVMHFSLRSQTRHPSSWAAWSAAFLCTSSQSLMGCQLSLALATKVWFLWALLWDIGKKKNLNDLKLFLKKLPGTSMWENYIFANLCYKCFEPNQDILSRYFP